MSHSDYREEYKEEELILIQLRRGDEDAFIVLYNKYRPQVYHIALQYLKSTDFAKEIVQDIFLKIWIERESLRHISSLKAWIYKVSKNHILNRLKRIAIEDQAKDYFVKNYIDEDLATIQQLEHREYHKILQEAIQSLPAQQRRVFELARYENLTYEAIAQEMEISPLTVKTHMARALANLRTKMYTIGLEVPLILFLLEDFF